METEWTEEWLVRHCAPTLAGLKTGSLVTRAYASPSALAAELRRLNRLLAGKGLRVLPLRSRSGRALVYLCRPAMLRRDLAEPEAARLLGQLGYPQLETPCCLAELRRRLREQAEFPHEIGLFLGYPPEDVRGFIENGAAHCKCAGVWKVYGDEQRAQRLFAQYKQCTRAYCAQWSRGVPLERLAVAGTI